MKKKALVEQLSVVADDGEEHFAVFEAEDGLRHLDLDAAKVFSVTTDDGEEHFVWSESEEGENTYRHMSSIVADNGDQVFDIATTHASAQELASCIAHGWGIEEPIPQPFLSIRPTTFPGHKRKDGTLVVKQGGKVVEVDTWRPDVSLVTFNPMDHSEDRHLFEAVFDQDSFTQAATAFLSLIHISEPTRPY